jgi:hypothetical protein
MFATVLGDRATRVVENPRLVAEVGEGLLVMGM